MDPGEQDPLYIGTISVFSSQQVPAEQVQRNSMIQHIVKKKKKLANNKCTHQEAAFTDFLS